jgi:1,2-diacylglycerol 3-beta-glucosyltransferase
MTSLATRLWHTANGVTAVAALPTALAGGYLGALTMFSKASSTPLGDRSVRFCIVVPAHNEEVGIAATVKSLRELDYPSDHFEILVIADNCSDLTAARAREAGAQALPTGSPSASSSASAASTASATVKVHERFDDNRKSKGFALSDVFPLVLADSAIDAVVVIDADTEVTPNLLTAIGARYASGAKAVQVDYRVANANDGWRTQLMTVAFTCFHDVRSLGREHFKLSAGLRGNGMSFSREALEKVPHTAASLVEDLEYGIALAKHGIRVHYVHEAFVKAEMPIDDAAAASQRERWERGRAQMRKEHGWSLLRSAVRERNAVKADLAADVLLPPVTSVIRSAAFPVAASVGLSILRRRLAWSLLPAGMGLSGLLIHVFTGWRRSGGDLSTLRAIPGYMRWKSGLTLQAGAADNAWVRTRRIAEGSSPALGHTAGPDANTSADVTPIPGVSPVGGNAQHPHDSQGVSS